MWRHLESVRWTNVFGYLWVHGSHVSSVLGVDHFGLHGNAQGTFGSVGGQFVVSRRAAKQPVAPFGCIRAVLATLVCSLQLQVGASRTRRKLWNGTISSLLFGNDLSDPSIYFAFLTSSSNPLLQVPLSMDDWTMVLAWAAPILLVDEVLKAVGRFLIRKDIHDSSKKTV